MFVKKNVNKSHPRYEEYISKCRDLFHIYEEKIEAEHAKYPNWRGLDHPSDIEVRLLERECNSKLRDLQREYDFLFSDVTDDER